MLLTRIACMYLVSGISHGCALLFGPFLGIIDERGTVLGRLGRDLRLVGLLIRKDLRSNNAYKDFDSLEISWMHCFTHGDVCYRAMSGDLVIAEPVLMEMGLRALISLIFAQVPLRYRMDRYPKHFEL